jgi:acyl carrier protein
MITRDVVQEFVVTYLRARYPKARAATLEAGTNLVTSGIIDSLAFLDLVSEIESHFKMKIDVVRFDYDTLITLGGLCDAAVSSA